MRIHNFLPIFSLSALMSGFSYFLDASKATTPQEQAIVAAPATWQSLFDGKTTQGWHTYGKQSAGKAWIVDKGTLHLDTSKKQNGQDNEGGDLVSNEEFQNFHLKLDWKIAPNGNSGVVIYVQDDIAKYPNTWSTGPEIQVLDNAGHPDAKIHKHRAGDLYDLIASTPETAKPAGQWNHIEIISQNGRFEISQNGKTVVTTTMWNDQWKALIAGSKFANMPGFGTFKSGKIALQDHGDKVWYRNIMIKRL